MDKKHKRQAIFVSDEAYALVLKIQTMAMKNGKAINKGEVIERLLNHDPIVMKYFNNLHKEV